MKSDAQAATLPPQAKKKKNAYPYISKTASFAARLIKSDIKKNIKKITYFGM